MERNSFALRRLHSLTGLVFGGYLIFHLLINATLAEGSRFSGEPTVYQKQVDMIHALPLFEPIQWVFIYLPIIFHTLYGILIAVTGQPNMSAYSYKKNWFYYFQRVSAAVLILFILFHVLGFKGLLGDSLTFHPKYATETAAMHMNSHWLVAYIIYPVGILAATYHLANGFWTAGITWGLTVSAEAQRRWGYVCLGLFLLTLTCATVAWASLVVMGHPAQVPEAWRQLPH